MLRKLEGAKAEQFKEIVSGDETTVVQVDQIRYLIARLPVLNEVQFDIESDPSLAAEIEDANRDLPKVVYIPQQRLFECLNAVILVVGGSRLYSLGYRFLVCFENQSAMSSTDK